MVQFFFFLAENGISWTSGHERKNLNIFFCGWCRSINETAPYTHVFYTHNFYIYSVFFVILSLYIKRYTYYIVCSNGCFRNFFLAVYDIIKQQSILLFFSSTLNIYINISYSLHSHKYKTKTKNTKHSSYSVE